MSGKQTPPEGDENQRRRAAREARAQGKLPSEMGATRGASSQTKQAPRNASPQERLEQRHEGKQGQSGTGNRSKERARPRSRDVDPRHESREG